jgi:ABC-2 type transport system permease protein
MPVSKKTFIIAVREVVENLRTKAFWIGILAVPILIVAGVVVPIWLDKAKGVRKYVVIDHSGWLLQAIEDRAMEPDFEKVLRALIDARVGEGKPKVGIADLQARLEGAMGDLANEKDLKQEELSKVAEALRDNKKLLDEGLAQAGKLYRELGRPEGQAILSALPEKAKTAVLAMRQTIIEWWRALPDEDSRSYQNRSGRGKYERVVIDGSGEVLLEDLNKRILSEELFAYFEIGKDPLKGDDGCRYVSSNLTDDDLRRWFEGLASDIVREKRMESEDIDDRTAEWLLAKLDFEDKQVSKTGETTEVKDEDQARQYAPVAFVYLLWIAIFSIAQMLLTNTVEEKSNRVLEVLLSSVSPLELMLGKIFGIAATGLSMILTWVISFIVCVRFLPGLMGVDNFKLEVIARDPVLLGSFVAYFLAGYLLYAALFVGIGSVCNSVKEAGNLMMPVTMILMVPLFSMIPIMKDPNGGLATLLSYIPPFTPFVMMNRAAGPPAPHEYIITSILLVVSILFVIWAAAKVFRVGVLMTGKAPTPKEILTWIKAPVGHVATRGEE